MGTLRRTCVTAPRRGPLPKLFWADLLLVYCGTLCRVLKPFIRRDYESRPLKMRLLQEIVAYLHR